MKPPVERLKEAIENRRAVLVIGSGTSVMATNGAPCASWRGLLEHGVATCEQQGWWNAKEAASCRSLLDVDQLVLAAQMLKQGILKGG